MNRATVRAALAAWKRMEKQKERILKDKEVQALFEQGANARANEIIAIRYPEVAEEKARRIALVKAVISFAPGVKLDPEQIVRNAAHFKRVVDLAEKM